MQQPKLGRVFQVQGVHTSDVVLQGEKGFQIIAVIT